jgi:hypothetical protein
MRTNGRVVFERAAVEMLKADREIAKAQRKEEAVEKETRAVNAESDTRQVVFLAQDRAFEEQRERRQLRETMDAMRLELERLREDARCRARAAQLTELRGRARLRPTSPAAGLVDMLLELAPIALLAAAAYAVRDAKPMAAPAPEAGQPRTLVRPQRTRFLRVVDQRANRLEMSSVGRRRAGPKSSKTAVNSSPYA